jgi:hypothetical protein
VINFAVGPRSVAGLALLVAGLSAGRARAQAADSVSQTAAPVFVNRTGYSGVGLNLGNVETGVTAKLWASSTVAVQAALGGPPEGNAVHLNADVTFSPYQWRSADKQYVLPFYAGVGGVLQHAFASGPRPASTEAGFRIPLGMSILVANNPVELFFEIAPELTIRSPSAAGRSTIYADGAIGVRFYP